MLKQPVAKTTLQKLLNEKGWSRNQLQTQTFVRTGVSISLDIIHQLCRGDRKLYPRWKEAIAKTLEVEESFLLTELPVSAESADEELTQ